MQTAREKTHEWALLKSCHCQGGWGDLTHAKILFGGFYIVFSVDTSKKQNKLRILLFA